MATYYDLPHTQDHGMVIAKDGRLQAERTSGNGGSDSSSNAWRGLRSPPAPAARGFFPPEFVVHVKALACELPAHLGVPLSRMSTSDVAAEARRTGLVAR